MSAEFIHTEIAALYDREKSADAQITSLGEERIKRGNTTLQRHFRGNVYGHDVYVDAPTLPDGTSIFDYQSSPEDIDGMISEELSTGVRKFQNYPFEVDVLSTKIIKEVPDIQGTRMVVAAAHTLGEHYKNGLGYRVPKEVAWNPAKPITYLDENGIEQTRMENEDETRTYIRVTYNPWQPGVVTTRLIQRNDPGFRGYESIYQKQLAEEQLQEKLRLKAEKKVTNKQGDIVVFEPLATAAD